MVDIPPGDRDSVTRANLEIPLHRQHGGRVQDANAYTSIAAHTEHRRDVREAEVVKVPRTEARRVVDRVAARFGADSHAARAAIS